jgi:phosphonopyruvate decarboxylase
MIDPKIFFDSLLSRGVGLYTGVPDSLLANFCAYVDDFCGRDGHQITANEGNAVAVAMGYHMATGKFAAVYMQNSGLGNAINPLTSLADIEVYRVPMLLIIGWRGEPGVKDEPQHVKQGRITLEQLRVLDVPHWVLSANAGLDVTLEAAFGAMKKRNAPVALVVRKDTFSNYKSRSVPAALSDMSREDALRRVLELCCADDLVVSTTGKTSREVFELRAQRGEAQRDFLTVGGMGHTASIALGVAMGVPNRRVVCLDGDGSLLMHLGAMPVIAQAKPQRFVHVLLNNGAHESVGGQATSADMVNFEKLAGAVGYSAYAYSSTLESLGDAWSRLSVVRGPVLLELKIRCWSRDDLGRPTRTAEQNKLAFMGAIHGTNK